MSLIVLQYFSLILNIDKTFFNCDVVNLLVLLFNVGIVCVFVLNFCIFELFIKVFSARTRLRSGSYMLSNLDSMLVSCCCTACAFARMSDSAFTALSRLAATADREGAGGAASPPPTLLTRCWWDCAMPRLAIAAPACTLGLSPDGQVSCL